MVSWIINSSPPKVGIDVDGVLANFVADHREICIEMFGRPDRHLEPTDFGFQNYGLTSRELGAVWSFIAAVPNFWLGLKPLPETQRLRRLEAECFFITNRPTATGISARIQTAMWLGRWYGLMFPTVLVVDHKGPLAAALGLAYFIDDHPPNCLDVLQAAPECKVFLRDATHNQGFARPGIIRVTHFNQFANLISEDIEKQ